MSLSGKTIVARSPAEEQEEAPAAKKATRDDEPIRVRARDGEEVTMSREVARLAGHLKDLMDDASSEDGVYPVPIVTASTLRALVRMSEIARSDPGVHRMEPCQNKSFEELRSEAEGYASNPLLPSSDEYSLLQLIMEHVEGALFLDAPMLLKHNQSVIASLVNGKNADELRALLGAGSDFDGAELEAALAESAFLPEGYEAPQQLGAASSTAPLAPLRQPSLSGVPATTDAREAALGMVDVATLCELKGVNRSWRALSRRVLCSRLCRGRGQPAPTHLEEITDLDVELLIEAGRPGDTALAGRMLPGLARLHGYGFVVDVAKVRAATLDDEDDEDDDENNDEGQEGSLLRGTAKAALDSCISGDGEAPLKLTIAAVACAGSGVVCGIPVQHMREDTMTELDLRNKGLQGPAAMLISSLIPATGGLTKISLAENKLGEEGTKAICEALEQNKTLKELDISGSFHGKSDNIGGAAGVKHVAKMLGVNGGLTSINLSKNHLTNYGTDMTGVKELAAALGVNGGLTSIDLSNNRLCGVWTDYSGQHGTYTAEGITAIADAMRVNGALTSISLANNMISGIGGQYSDGSGDLRGAFSIEGIAALADALSKSMTLRSVDLSNNSLAGVNRSGHGTFRPEGINLIADAIRVNGALTMANFLGNQLDAESAKMLAEVAKQKGISLCGIQRDQTIADFRYKRLEPPDAILLASDLSQAVVTGGLTSINLSGNRLTNYGTDMTGIKELAAALGVNGGLTKIE